MGLIINVPFLGTLKKNLECPFSWEMSWMIREKNPSVVHDELPRCCTLNVFNMQSQIFKLCWDLLLCSSETSFIITLAYSGVE